MYNGDREFYIRVFYANVKRNDKSQFSVNLLTVLFSFRDFFRYIVVRNYL